VTRDPIILMRAFVTYVRPLVEYYTTIWYPKSAYDIKLVEKVQRRYTKRIASIANLTYADCLECLSLDSLELRWLRFDLHNVFKIVHNLIDFPANNLFVNSTTSTRQAEFKFFKPRCESSNRSNFFSLRIINC